MKTSCLFYETIEKKYAIVSLKKEEELFTMKNSNKALRSDNCNLILTKEEIIELQKTLKVVLDNF